MKVHTMAEFTLNLHASDPEFASTHNFAINLANPIYLDTDYEVALQHGALWYSFYNIRASFNNNTLSYSPDGVNWHVVTLPDGFYELTDIEAALHAAMVLNGHVPANITITGNFISYRCEIQLVAPYAIDLSAGGADGFCKILGFNPAIYNLAVNTGQNPADLMHGITSLHVECNLISAVNTNSIFNSSIYSFIPDAAPGNLLSLNPSQLIFYPLNTRAISQIQIRITDQLGRFVDLNREPVTLVLRFRPIVGYSTLLPQDQNMRLKRLRS